MIREGMGMSSVVCVLPVCLLYMRTMKFQKKEIYPCKQGLDLDFIGYLSVN